MSKEPWHLNRSVPVTLIFAIVIQAAAIVAAGTDMRGDIDSNRNNIGRNGVEIAVAKNRLEAKSERLETSVQAQAVALARIEESLKNIHTRLNEIINRRKPQ